MKEVKARCKSVTHGAQLNNNLLHNYVQLDRAAIFYWREDRCWPTDYYLSNNAIAFRYCWWKI